MRLADRGQIREGMAADIVVFDVNTIRDKATFFEPHQYAEGVDYVITNGEFLVDAGKLTWKLPGKLLMTGGSRPAPFAPDDPKLSPTPPRRPPLREP